jgi:hypothetical protein
MQNPVGPMSPEGARMPDALHGLPWPLGPALWVAELSKTHFLMFFFWGGRAFINRGWGLPR